MARRIEQRSSPHLFYDPRSFSFSVALALLLPFGDFVVIGFVVEPRAERLRPLGEEMLLEKTDDGRRRQHVRPGHHPIPLIQDLMMGVDL